MVAGGVGRRASARSGARGAGGDVALPLAVDDRLELEPAALRPGAVHVHVHQPVVQPIPGG